MPPKEVEINLEKIGSKHICPECEQTFTERSSLNRHLRKQTCTNPKPTKMELIEYVNLHKASQFATKDDIGNIIKAIKDVSDKVDKNSNGSVVNNHNHNQHNLNIMCLGSNDNLLDMLSASEGLPLALTYVKGCALSRLAGDCRILERVYKLDTAQAAIQMIHKSKTKFVYYDERQRRTVESNAKVLAKKLAAILQRSYLKGMESFQTDILGNQRENYQLTQDLDQNSMPELAPYDIQLWNAHVHELADEKYQKKILSSLKIPMEPPRE